MTEVIQDFVVMLVSQVLMVPPDVQVYQASQVFQVNKAPKALGASQDNKVSNKQCYLRENFNRTTRISRRRWTAR